MIDLHLETRVCIRLTRNLLILLVRVQPWNWHLEMEWVKVETHIMLPIARHQTIMQGKLEAASDKASSKVATIDLLLFLKDNQEIIWLEAEVLDFSQWKQIMLKV